MLDLKFIPSIAVELLSRAQCMRSLLRNRILPVLFEENVFVNSKYFFSFWGDCISVCQATCIWWLAETRAGLKKYSICEERTEVWEMSKRKWEKHFVIEKSWRFGSLICCMLYASCTVSLNSPLVYIKQVEGNNLQILVCWRLRNFSGLDHDNSIHSLTESSFFHIWP